MKRFTTFYIVLCLAASLALGGGVLLWAGFHYSNTGLLVGEPSTAVKVLGLFVMSCGIGIFFKEVTHVKARYREEGTVPASTFKLVRYDNVVLVTKNNRAYVIDEEQAARFELGLPVKTVTYYDKNKTKLNKYFIF